MKWHSIAEKPHYNTRILVFSSCYKDNDPMQFRIIDSQFLSITTDVDYWSFLEPPL
jgi:hypothetical protein